MIELLLVLAAVAGIVAIAAALWRRRSRLAGEQSHEQTYQHEAARRGDSPRGPEAQPPDFPAGRTGV
jgi:type II secretory pathway pseudopilin PulG